MSKSVYFIRAKSEETLWTEEKKNHVPSLTGEEARDFYQSLLEDRDRDSERTREGGGKTSGRRAELKRRRDGRRVADAQVRPNGTSEHDGHKLLLCAQEGNTRALTELLQHGCDVNFRDSFYWTAVMCASQAGKAEAVRLLLQYGAAWVGVVDKQGRDARALALQAGHQDVVRELEQFCVSEMTNTPVAEDANSSQWCSVCAVHYTDNTHVHNRSTLHQFSELRPPATPQYCLPPTSTSYKMMLRSGWDPFSGLGPAHCGRKNPIGTVLKRERKGLGYGVTPQSKVTHFQAKDPQAVQQTPKENRLRQERGSKLSAKEHKRKEEKDRRWERDYRSSFNFDL